jgi:Tol biopolymer transport system component
LLLTLVGCSGADGAPTPTPANTASWREPATETGALPKILDEEPRHLFNVDTGAGGGIVLTRLDGSDPVRLAGDVPGIHKHSDWSPTGKDVVFVDERYETMWIAHLDGSPTERVTICDDGGCDYPSYSPDGTKLAFSRYETADGVTGPSAGAPSALAIQVLDLATGEVSTVTRLERPLLADRPQWSPDGAELVIGVDRLDDEAWETGAAIATVPVQGGKLTYLTGFDNYAYSPDWNPRTGEIVFGPNAREYKKDVNMAEETWNIFILEPDGTDLRQVTNAADGEQFKGARWTPDGSEILAWSSRMGAVAVNPESGAIQQITSPQNTGVPRLRPDPS